VRSCEKIPERRLNGLRHLAKACACHGGAGGFACLAHQRTFFSQLLRERYARIPKTVTHRQLPGGARHESGGKTDCPTKRQEPERTLCARRLAVAGIHISKSHGISVRANRGNPARRHGYPCKSVSIRGLFPFVRQEKWATDGHGFRTGFENYPCRDRELCRVHPCDDLLLLHMLRTQLRADPRRPARRDRDTLGQE
jgi:hypothetical protein